MNLFLDQADFAYAALHVHLNGWVGLAVRVVHVCVAFAAHTVGIDATDAAGSVHVDSNIFWQLDSCGADSALNIH